jgi:hypothetical protein
MNGIGTVALALASILAWAAPAWPADQEARYSGTVVSVDRAGGLIVVEGMGPWRVEGGVTQLERRSIAVGPSTALVKVRRASGVAPSGWTGDFVESMLEPWQVGGGDWVTVTFKHDGGRPAAIRITVVDPGAP